ncbi:MAG: VWA domain-containing protein, partial [Planctomycetota bacterium]
LYRFNIFPIPGKGKKIIRFEYTVPLQRKGECAALSIPLKSAGLMRKPIGTFLLTTDIEMPGGISQVSSTSYKIGAKYEDKTRATVTLARSKFIPKRDLDIIIQGADRELGKALMRCKGNDGRDFFCVEIAPTRLFKPDDIQPKDVTYILDVSGSMYGEPLAAAKKALLDSASRLNPSDRFRLVQFGCDAKYALEKFIGTSPEEFERFAKIVRETNDGGGTNMEAGLRLGLKRTSGGRLHYVVLISDGYPGPGLSSEKELVRMLKGLMNDRTRLFALGIGSGVNLFLMEQLAVAGHGFSGIVPDDSFIASRMNDFMQKFNYPIFEEAEILCSGPRVRDLAPEKMPALFAGRPVRIFGRYEGTEPLTVRLSGTYLGERKNYTFAFDLENDAVESPDLPVLWASRRAAALMDEIKLTGNEDLKNEVITIAARYGIVTPYTSYLVTENGKVPENVKSFLEWWNGSRGGSSSTAASGRTTTVSTSPKFFGMEINSGRILFILDVSGSMKQPCGSKEDGPDCPKLDRAVKELGKVIGKLDKGVKFNLLVFSNGVKTWQKTLIRANRKSKKAAIKFLEELSPSGETFMTQAFEKAFEMNDFDTLCFISDGAPRENGKPVEPKTVLDKMESMNCFRKIRIFTVGFKGADIELMEKLAELGCGAFRYVGDMKIIRNFSNKPDFDPLSSFRNTPEVREIRKLWKNFSKGSLRKILKIAVKSKEVNTVKAAEAALKALDSPCDRLTICGQMKNETDYRARIILAEALGSYTRRPEALEALGHAAMREKTGAALRAEVCAISNFRDKTSVNILAELWLKLDGDVAARSVIALVRDAIELITGIGDISSAADFRKWWEVAKDSFQLPLSPGSAGLSGQKLLGDMRTADNAESLAGNAKVKRIGSKTFVRKENLWVDTDYREGEPLQDVKFLSSEYWKLAEDEGWARFLAIGANAIICHAGKNMKITSDDKTVARAAGN